MTIRWGLETVNAFSIPMTEFKTTRPLERLSKTLGSSKALKKQTADKLGCDVLFVVAKGKDKQHWLLKGKEADAISLEKVGDSPNTSDIVIRVDDVNLTKLIKGKSSAQKLFMIGKLKIKGNVMKAAYIETLLKHAESSKL